MRRCGITFTFIPEEYLDHGRKINVVFYARREHEKPRVVYVVELMRNGSLMGVLFVDNGEESKRLLERLGELKEKIQVIDVSKNGVRGWLLLEYGTMEVPLLVTEHAVLTDAESILDFLKKTVHA